MSDSIQLLIDTLPNGWEARKLKYLATYNDEVLPENTAPDTEIEYVEISDVSLAEGVRQSTFLNFKDAPSRARRIAQNGDVIISTVRTYLKAIAAISKTDGKLIVSTGFCVVRPGAEIKSRYLGWVAKSERFISAVVNRSVGVSYPAINSGEIASLFIPVPDSSTQRQIADFLDERTALIDELVAKKERLLKLLAEKRRALITRAVTKGLDPAAAMKPSGADYISDIPAHWELKRLNHIFRFRSGDFLPSDEIKKGGLVPVYGGNGIRGYTDESNTDGGVALVGRQGAHCGNVHLMERDGWVTEHALRCFPETKFNAAWLAHFLSCMDLNAMSVSAAQPGLSVDRIKMLIAAVPPLAEQNQIADFITARAREIDNTASKILTSVERLQEYRSALITAAVTGQFNLESA